MSTGNSQSNTQITPLLVAAGVVAATSAAAYVLYRWKRSAKSPVTLLDPQTKYAMPLISKTTVNHNTRRFRFGLPSAEHVLGLPIGQHIYLSAQVDGKLVVRPYTPTSDDRCKGYFELVIKVYFANEHPKFPEGGKMSQHLEGMAIGDRIDVRGPSGLLIYEGHGKFAIREKKTTPPQMVKAAHVAMIAGGTGITPMYQLMRHILDLEGDVKLSLIFANQTEDDILLREELDQMATAHADRLRVWYTVDRPPTDREWRYSSGFVSADMISEHLPGPADDVLVVMCGPPPMVNMACVPALEKLGYPANRRFAY